jgi:hypothetical protein
VRRVVPYLRCPSLLRFCRWGGFAGVLLASSTCLLNILTRGIDWITRSFPDFDNLWEVPPWLH